MGALVLNVWLGRSGRYQIPAHESDAETLDTHHLSRCLGIVLLWSRVLETCSRPKKISGLQTPPPSVSNHKRLQTRFVDVRFGSIGLPCSAIRKPHGGG